MQPTKKDIVHRAGNPIGYASSPRNSSLATPAYSSKLFAECTSKIIVYNILSILLSLFFQVKTKNQESSGLV